MSSRITRSKTEKSVGDSQLVVQVPPPIEQENLRIVKRVDFVKVKTFYTNDIILAKQKYSLPWPAQILNVDKDKISVYFFGDRRTGFVSSSELYDFRKSSPALKSIISKKKNHAVF